MENPATWNRATEVIFEALVEDERQKKAGVIGLSGARIIHDALEREGLLTSDTPKTQKEATPGCIARGHVWGDTTPRMEIRCIVCNELKSETHKEAVLPLNLKPRCQACKGTGQVSRVGFTSAAHMDSDPAFIVQTCRICHGRGWVYLPADELTEMLLEALTKLAALPVATEGEKDVLIQSALDEALMKSSLLLCYGDKVTGLRVSTEHYRYLAEQIVSLRRVNTLYRAWASRPQFQLPTNEGPK